MPLPVETWNELLDTLERVLRRHPEGLSEYDLLNLLGHAEDSPFPCARFDDPLHLFRAHFLLFHLLYRLQERLCRERRAGLRVHCLRIELLPYRPARGALAVEHDAVRAYYLDLANLARTTREDVRQLLDSFWWRFTRRERRRHALAVLGLDADAPPAAIKRRYRQLAMRHHPDRGGDTRRLQEINGAMRVLEQGAH